MKLTYRYDFTIKEEIVELKGQVNFEGHVLERFTSAPLQGVKVKIVDLDVEVGTDEQGAFAFQDVPAGTHQIELHYRNPLIAIGAAVTLLTLLGIVAIVLMPATLFDFADQAA